MDGFLGHWPLGFLPPDTLHFGRALIVVFPMAQLTTSRTWKFLLELVEPGLALIRLLTFSRELSRSVQICSALFGNDHHGRCFLVLGLPIRRLKPHLPRGRALPRPLHPGPRPLGQSTLLTVFDAREQPPRKARARGIAVSMASPVARTRIDSSQHSRFVTVSQLTTWPVSRTRVPQSKDSLVQPLPRSVSTNC